MFPAASKSFERRTARAGSGERRPLPASRVGRRHEAAIRIDIAALGNPAGEENGTNGFSVGLPESAFRSAGGEPICFIELPPENESVDDERLDACPDASAALTPRLASQAGRRTKLALFASVALHVLAAASLVTWMQDDGAQIAGGTPSEIAGIGNASTDQIASGAAVNVTITTIPIVKAHAVETETLHAAAEPVRETPAQATPVEAAGQVEPAQPVAAATMVSTVSEAPMVEPQASAASAQADTAQADVGAPVSDVPEILATPLLSDAADAVVAVQALAEAVPSAEIPPAQDAPQLAEHAPLPTPRPQRAEQPVEKAERKKPVRSAARPSAPGSGGHDQADAKRGVAEGRADGRAASSNDNARVASAAGNAAVSNYPGKIIAKLRRALRYPSEARGRRLNGVVQVRFVVGSSGDVGSVGLAASSGSPILDKAALATVQRAAPFPPIPEGAGRRSWAFTVPLAFVR